MDSLRGKFGYSGDAEDDASWDHGDEDSDYSVDDAPPGPVGQDERRMQVRAYNYWAGLLGERTFPSVEDIEPDSLPEFAENSVLLDFTGGVENPAIVFLGDRLAGECGHDGPIQTLDDVPSRSLLSRITDHYMQILANEAPIGFEAEFINQAGLTILYRGILLPFSTDDETIDFLYGVINWKEVADQLTTDELLLEIDQALEGKPDKDDDGSLPTKAERVLITPSITRWADGPGADADEEETGDESQSLPAPTFARLDAHLAVEESDRPGEAELGFAVGATDDEAFVGVFDPLAGFRTPEPDHGAPHTGASGLHACLAEARALAEAAHDAESRSRAALYRAVGRAYDVSLAALGEPDAFQDLLDKNAIAVQPRAPMTPVVKLVFGADYDKTRIAEYAAVLALAQREGVAGGALAEHIEATAGGIKALVARERAFRHANEPEAAAQTAAQSRVHARLDRLETRALEDIPVEGAPFSLCVIRRSESGEIAFLGEIADDDRLLARAAKRLVG